MKLTWPRAIVLSFLLFFGFIGYWVVQIETKSGFKHELVHEDYYEEETHFNHYRKAEDNAKAWEKTLQMKQRGDQVYWFPLPENKKIILRGYFPAAAQQDFTYELVSDSLGYLFLPPFHLSKGNWIFYFSWQDQSEAYRVTKQYYY